LQKAASTTPVPDSLSSKDRALLTTFFSDEATAELEQATLAANLSDSGQTTSEGVQLGATAGSDGVVEEWFKKASVDVNPSTAPGTGTRSFRDRLAVRHRVERGARSQRRSHQQ